MKIRRETKIGLLATITILLAIFGYKYLQGINVLTASKIIYAEYDNVMALRESTPVLIHGFKVGLVANIFQKPGDISKIVVEMNIDPDVNIPKTAEAAITVQSLMGDKAIYLHFEGTCEGDACAKNGDYIKGVTLGTVESMMGLDDLKSYMDVLNEGLADIFEELKKQIEDNEKIGQTLNDLSATIANLKSVSGRLDHVLAVSSGSIKGTLANLKSITDSIDAGSGHLKNMIKNTDEFAGKMNELELSETLDEAKTTFQKLQGTLSSADLAIAELNEVLKKAKSGDNTLSLLLSDKAFADKLNLTVKDLQLLLQDIRLHPERYRRVLSKKKMKYEAPEEDRGYEKN